jgi:hypothetical protein
MMKILTHYTLLFFVMIVLTTHILKLIYVFYKPNFLSKYKYFSNEIPSKNNLILYYILTITVCYYIIKNIINR